ncbi:Mitotic arrest deficient 1 [Hyphodiscus hymeniophilus]|uniref:Spindle assembly checkpoint component MAD1 n=1 Tax=Hyphodiscus hymeniophilus TaxID=353542 RepID=A0A9P6VJ92_9HELO|nr:Mitotic arrest deficient 1 [Hyphodiscus hymeniophilus]
MSAHKPPPMDTSRRRSSITAHRTSLGPSTLPRPQSRGPTSRLTDHVLLRKIALVRASNTQPSYDFLTGQDSTNRQPHDALRSSTRNPPAEPSREIVTSANEDEAEKCRMELAATKAEVKKLSYTIENHKQEGELVKLRYESDLREARRKAEDDFKKMQVAEGEKARAVRQFESLQREMTEVRDAVSNEKAALERRLREAEESKRTAEEEIEDVKTAGEEELRVVERRSSELQSRNDTLQRTVEELQQDSDRRESLLQLAQQHLADKETSQGALEAEIIRLKAQTGDAETLAIIKRELGEQVAHIKKIEALTRKQALELEHYRQLHKSIEIVEEEKRSLQRKVDSMEGLRNELGEAQIQRQRLEDERLAWTAYLESQAGADGRAEFDSPEALARAFIEERLRTAALIERIGALEPELMDKDGIIRGLESQKSDLVEQIEKLKASGVTSMIGASGDNKARLRLERQRALAIREVEYLRAQLKNFDAEETTFQPENLDEAKIKRIQELEDTVDHYRQEVQTLHADLATRESSVPASETTGTKRQRDASEENEHIGVLSRKNRKLQDELTTFQTSTKLLQKEIAVVQERLTAATKQSATRILSLRSNPTSDHEAIKQSTLDLLRKENTDLKEHIQSGKRSTVQTIPISSLEAAQRDVRNVQLELASEKKGKDRLKKVWQLKTREFRELVISLLGWDVVFMPNGKTKVSSFFYPSKGEEENSIEFDGERGTMKVSGGPQSKFAGRIGEQIKFWVHDKGSVPCFLAALTLEFYEEMNRDSTMIVDG